MSVVVFDVGAENIATQLFNGATILPYVRVFQNNYVPTDTSVTANFTLATYDGAAPIATAAPAVSSLGAGAGSLLTWPAVTFQPTDSLVPNTVYGYIVSDGGGTFDDTTSLWCERNPAGGVSLADPSDSLSIALQLSFVSDSDGTIVTPDSGTAALAAAACNLSGAMALPLTMHLYTNNYTPVTTSLLSNFTEVTTGAMPGYAAQTLSTPVVSTPTPGNGALTTWTMLSWTPTGTITPVNIYGYYVTDANGVLMWAERAPVPPVVLSTVATTLNITPRYGLDSAA